MKKVILYFNNIEEIEMRKIKEKEIGNFNNDSFGNRNFCNSISSGISHREDLFDQLNFIDDKEVEIEDKGNILVLMKR